MDLSIFFFKVLLASFLAYMILILIFSLWIFGVVTLQLRFNLSVLSAIQITFEGINILRTLSNSLGRLYQLSVTALFLHKYLQRKAIFGKPIVHVDTLFFVSLFVLCGHSHTFFSLHGCIFILHFRILYMFI